MCQKNRKNCSKCHSPMWLPTHKHDWVHRKLEITFHCHLSQAHLMAAGQSPPRSRRTAVRAHGCICPLHVHPEESIICRQECAHVGGDWGEHLPSSISRKYTEEASTPETPFTLPPVFLRASLTTLCSSWSVCTYSSSVPSAAQAHQMNKTFINLTGAVARCCSCNKYGSKPGKPNDYMCL